MSFSSFGSLFWFAFHLLGFHHCKKLNWLPFHPIHSIAKHKHLGTKCWTVIRNCSNPLGRFLGLINAVVKTSNTQFLNIQIVFFFSIFFLKISNNRVEKCKCQFVLMKPPVGFFEGVWKNENWRFFDRGCFSHTWNRWFFDPRFLLLKYPEPGDTWPWLSFFQAPPELQAPYVCGSDGSSTLIRWFFDLDGSHAGSLIQVVLIPGTSGCWKSQMAAKHWLGIWFLLYPFGFGYWKKIQNRRTAEPGYLKTNQMQGTAGSGYLKQVQRTAGFHEKNRQRPDSFKTGSCLPFSKSWEPSIYEYKNTKFDFFISTDMHQNRVFDFLITTVMNENQAFD